MKKLAFNKRQVLIIIGLVSLSLGVVLFLTIHLPIINESRQIRYKTASLENDIKTMDGFISNHGKNEEQGRLVYESEINEVMKILVESGRVYEVEFISILPKEIKKEEGSYYSRLPVEMELLSGYKNLGEFIGAIENLEETRVAIANLEINRDEKVLPLMKSELTLEIYLKNE